MLSKTTLEYLYTKKRLSSVQIGKKCRCSPNQVNYWLKKHDIPKRSISDAVYTLRNPKGDPFNVKEQSFSGDAFLFGLGLGLYWGEGTKANKGSVRLGNTDPSLILAFIKFLKMACGVKKEKLHFGLQVFSDMKMSDAEQFWMRTLNVSSGQFYRTTITPSVVRGTYRRKVKHGVLTVYVNNSKLRNILVGKIEKLQRMYYH